MCHYMQSYRKKRIPNNGDDLQIKCFLLYWTCSVVNLIQTLFSLLTPKLTLYILSELVLSYVSGQSVKIIFKIIIISEDKIPAHGNGSIGSFCLYVTDQHLIYAVWDCRYGRLW